MTTLVVVVLALSPNIVVTTARRSGSRARRPGSTSASSVPSPPVPSSAARRRSARDPPNPGLPPDWPAFGLAALGTVTAFVAVSLLVSRGFASPAFMGLLSGGTVALVALLVLEYHKEEPLSPVKRMSSSPLPPAS